MSWGTAKPQSPWWLLLTALVPLACDLLLFCLALGWYLLLSSCDRFRTDGCRSYLGVGRGRLYPRRMDDRVLSAPPLPVPPPPRPPPAGGSGQTLVITA